MKVPSSNLSRQGGSTLIELLVTMAILTLILTLAVQVAESARMAIKLTESQSSNDATARLIFDRISRDLSQILIREDARIELKSKPGNDAFAFLTQAKGFTTTGAAGERNVSLVSYSLVHDASLGEQLLRGSCGHLCNDAASDALTLDASLPFPAISANNLQTLSNQLLRLEIEYLIEETSGVTVEVTPPATSESLRGLIITLITLDDQGRRVLKPSIQTAVAANFPDASPGTNTLKTWSLKRDEMARSGIPGLPKAVFQSLRCYQRTFLIP